MSALRCLKQHRKDSKTEEWCYKMLEIRTLIHHFVRIDLMEPKHLIEVKIRVNDTRYLINQCLKSPSKEQLGKCTFEL